MGKYRYEEFCLLGYNAGYSCGVQPNYSHHYENLKCNKVEMYLCPFLTSTADRCEWLDSSPSLFTPV
jgi:hypothetical protein